MTERERSEKREDAVERRKRLKQRHWRMVSEAMEDGAGFLQQQVAYEERDGHNVSCVRER